LLRTDLHGQRVRLCSAMGENICSQTQYQDQIFREERLKLCKIAASEFINCRFIDCSLVESVFHECRFVDVSFQGCDLSLLQIPECILSGLRFEDSKLIGVNWTLADWSAAKLGGPLYFSRSILSHSTFIGLDLIEIQIRDCMAVDVDFRETDLSSADFSGTDLAESLFGNTNLSNADLRSARNYTIDPGINNLKGTKFSMPEALSLLYIMDIDLSGEIE